MNSKIPTSSFCSYDSALKIDFLINQKIPKIITYYQEVRDAHKRWSPEPPAGFYEEHYWIERFKSFEDLNGVNELRVVIRDNLKILGLINFGNGERGCFQNIRLGYGIHPSLEGKGVMTSALKVLVPVIFEDLKFHRVEANYIPENVASCRVLEKCGFKKIGISTNYLKINGKWQDHIMTALTVENWRTPDPMYK